MYYLYLISIIRIVIISLLSSTGVAQGCPGDDAISHPGENGKLSSIVPWCGICLFPEASGGSFFFSVLGPSWKSWCARKSQGLIDQIQGLIDQLQGFIL